MRCLIRDLDAPGSRSFHAFLATVAQRFSGAGRDPIAQRFPKIAARRSIDALHRAIGWVSKIAPVRDSTSLVFLFRHILILRAKQLVGSAFSRAV